jgi:hypothetical protein
MDDNTENSAVEADQLAVGTVSADQVATNVFEETEKQHYELEHGDNLREVLEMGFHTVSSEHWPTPHDRLRAHEAGYLLRGRGEESGWDATKR